MEKNFKTENKNWNVSNDDFGDILWKLELINDSLSYYNKMIKNNPD